jgi:hypothetical protein
MFQHTIPVAIIKNNIIAENVISQVLMKLHVMYLPHAFKILDEDFGIEHWWGKSY